MRRAIRVGTGFLVASVVTWATAGGFLALQLNGSIAAMALVLEVLAVATIGDWLLAVLTSSAASLAFSWYYIDAVGSFRITTTEGAITFSMMVFTALTGSRLSVRAQKRAREAIRRRKEMERLQQLGNVLLAANTVQEAAWDVVRKVVELFGVTRAVLRLEGIEYAFGDPAASRLPRACLDLDAEPRKSVLELYGAQPSAEVCSALANLIRLVLDRARNAEDSARGEATRRGEELRATVLNALAHNFKTPLTSIKAAASMLRGSSDIPPAEGRELIAVIDEEADRLDQLIRESLNLARIEAHQTNPRTERCSLAEIFARVTSRVSRYLGGHQLIIDIADDLAPVMGDEFLFEQMLMQVVDNAWKYSRPGARIRVNAVESGSSVVLTVQNEGSFIPEDERERIFDKFYRGASSRSRVEGTGLGLAIAKAIAEAHGGTLWLDCEPGGPAFRFSLPLVPMGKNFDREPDHTANRR